MDEQQQKERVNFLKKYKLHELCRQDEFAPERNYVWFRNGSAYVNNGHAAIRANLADISTFSLDEQMLLDGKCVKGALFKQILNHDVVTITNEGFDAEVPGTGGILYRFSDPSNLKFPDIDKLIQTTKKLEQTDKTKHIGYNIEYLVDVSKAMGNVKLKMRIKDADRTIIVEPLGTSEDIIGLLAPILVDQE